MYLAAQVQRQVTKIAKALHGRRVITYDELIDHISIAVKPFGARAIKLVHRQPKDFISIGGEFDTIKKRKQIAIEVITSCESDKVRLKKGELDSILFLLYQTITHELIHKCQYECRDEDTPDYFLELEDGTVMNEDQLYLADCDEIEAYAHCLALEIFREYGPENWRDGLRKPPILCDTYAAYSRTFIGTDWKEIRQQLLKKTYRWCVSIHDNKEWYKCLN